MSVDPRQTHKELLETIPAASLTKDDNVTHATFSVLFEEPPINLLANYLSNSDLVFTVGYVRVDGKRRLQSVPHIFDGRLRVGAWTKNRTGITGEKLIWKAVLAIRTVYDGNAGLSQKCVISEDSEDQMIEGVKLYNYVFIVRHKTFKV